MLIGDRIRAIRQAKELSQGDIEERSALLRAYQSRVECGHTVPAVETLEKWARALEVQLYQLFYEGEEPPRIPSLLKGEVTTGRVARKEARELERFRQLLARMSERDRTLLLHAASKMARS